MHSADGSAQTSAPQHEAHAREVIGRDLEATSNRPSWIGTLRPDPSFILGLPATVTHEWRYGDGQGPLTLDVDGRLMRVTEIRIILAGDGKPLDISVRGQRARSNGQRDRRCSYGTTEPYDGWVAHAAAEQFGTEWRAKVAAALAGRRTD
jgi:hypothetical protein